MEETDLEWLESAIKDKCGVSKILSGSAELAVADGENYVSRVYRLSLRTLGAGLEDKRLSLIVKRKLDIDVRDNQTISEKLDQVFNKEYQVYTETLSRLERYAQEPGQTSLWPDCLAHVPNKDIYFEDLKASGYELADRLTGLDAEHCLVALRSLARLHAASAVAVERGEVDCAAHDRYLMFEASTTAQNFKSNAYAIMVDVIRTEWGHQWSEVADRLEELSPTLPSTVAGVGRLEHSGFNVLNHGDPWVNNMMFKYGSDGRPSSLKFVDFQICHYNSLGCDLSYLLSTSVDPRVKRQHLGRLLEEYCAEFGRTLARHGSGLAPPDPAALRRELRRLAPFSLNVSLRIRPIVMAPPQHSLPISELLKDTGLHSDKRKLYNHPAFTDVMKADLPYLLDLITK